MPLIGLARLCLAAVAAGLVFCPFGAFASDGAKAAEMARKLQDPLANISAVMTENDIMFKTGDGSTSYQFQIQPVHAMDFPEKGFTLIPRAVIPVVGAAPLADLPQLGDRLPGGGGTTWGLSDIVTQFFFAPKTTSAWKWGLGPQLSWGTHSDEILKGPDWGAGPVGVLVGSLGEQVVLAGIVGHLWSYDGDFSTTTIQPMLFYNIESVPGASIGYTATITADWKAEDSGDRWTVPLGMVVGRTFDLGGGYGLDLNAGPYWNLVKPEGAADWFIKFGVTLVLP